MHIGQSIVCIFKNVLLVQNIPFFISPLSKLIYKILSFVKKLDFAWDQDLVCLVLDKTHYFNKYKDPLLTFEASAVHMKETEADK